MVSRQGRHHEHRLILVVVDLEEVLVVGHLEAGMEAQVDMVEVHREVMEAKVDTEVVAAMVVQVEEEEVTAAKEVMEAKVALEVHKGDMVAKVGMGVEDKVDMAVAVTAEDHPEDMAAVHKVAMEVDHKVDTVEVAMEARVAVEKIGTMTAGEKIVLPVYEYTITCCCNFRLFK